MDMSKGERMVAANDNVEAPKETAMVLDRAGLMARKAEIAALPNDANDTGQNLNRQGTLAERKAFIDEATAALKEMPPTKLVLVTEKGGKITGCLVVNIGEHARVARLLLGSGNESQTVVITSLVNGALSGLKQGPHSYDKLHFNVNPATRSEALHQYVSNFPENNSRLIIEGAANDNKAEGAQDLNKAA